MSTNDHVADPEKVEPNYHPDFSSKGFSNFILIASDGVRFCVESQAMRRNSSVWDSMLSDLPKDQEQTAQVDDPSQPLATVLSIISGKPIPPLRDLDAIEPIIKIADKYQMEGILSIIRSFASTEVFSVEPIRAYGIAFDLRWEDEVKMLSQRTLQIDLGNQSYLSQLEFLSHQALLALLKLHLIRKHGIVNLVDKLLSTVSCPGCRKPGKLAATSDATKALKEAIALCIQGDPSGTSILDTSFANHPAVRVYSNDLSCTRCTRKVEMDIYPRLSDSVRNFTPKTIAFS